MNFTFETQGNNTFMVYSVSEKDNIDSMSLGMLTNNKIPGLATTIFTQMDSQKYIKYNITSKISVKQFFSGPVNKSRLMGVFNGIVDAMLSAEEYMIDDNSILLDLDYIFADVSTCETVLLCLPISCENRNVDIGVFFKNIMFSTQFDQTENCDHIAKIINYLNCTPVFSLIGFKGVLESIKKESNNKVQFAAPVVQGTEMQPNQMVSANVQRPQNKISNIIKDATSNVISERTNTAQNSTVNNVVQHNTIARPEPKLDSVIVNKTETVVNEEPEQKMSMFYLLQHYNKENAAIYKAQKDAKKTGAQDPKINTSSSKKSKEKNVKEKKAPSQAQPSSFGFAVPGQAQPMQGVNNATRSPVAPQPVQQQMQRPVVQQQTPQASAQQQNPSVQTGNYQPQRNVPHPFAQQQIPVVQNAPVQNNPVKNDPVQSVTPQNVNYGGSTTNFGETVVLNAGMTGDTTVLNTNMLNHIPDTPYLIRMKNNEKIHINKPVFRIGKEKSYVDYFIGDNTAISRSHANILERGGEYYITDTNSTNHTFVDNQMITSNQEHLIKKGSKIRLANEEFIFTIE